MLRRCLWSGWRAALTEVLGAMDAILGEQASGGARLGIIVLGVLAAWVIYVPIHELLHAFGCMAAGGEVQELQIKPLYGGRLLEGLFPFVRSGGAYAGRLTRFDVRGSDGIYLATDLAPFLLTLLFAFPLLALARQRRAATLLGPGIVLAAAPFMSLTGDLYEAGSILVSGALGRGALLAIRHDDLVALLAGFGERFPERRAIAASAIATSAGVGWLLGNTILLAGHALSERLVRTRLRKAQAA